MNYPGNPSLSPAVRDRVLSTFQQTVSLYGQGRNAEVEAGCQLILQMDPTFDPARKLLEKLRNPSLPIDVDQLLPVPAQDGRSPMDQAREAMAERDFERVLHLTTEILTNDLLNDDARILGDEAREKLEAAPFVDQFTRKAAQSLASGDTAGARAALEKARALDADHPEVLRLSAAAAGSASAPAAPAPTPSFVVDDQPSAAASGRSTAQAADFGFAFEEEKPAEVSFSNVSFEEPAKPAETDFSSFSFDSPSTSGGSASFGEFSFESSAPPPPPSAPASGSNAPAEFDFTTASVATSADDQKKIEQFLTDGDRAFGAGDYQQAIDLWSRIFLIDVTNDDASERIEKAKAKRREIEQQIDPLITSGVAAFEAGDAARARADFSEVLRLDPQNAAASDYIGRLEEAHPAALTASAEYEPPRFDDSIENDLFADEPNAPGLGAPLMPPPPPAAAAVRKEAKPAKATPSGKRALPMTAIAAAVGLLVILLGGWFVWSKFLNKPDSDPAATQATMTRAQTLANEGKFDQAIALLQNIQPDDPQHDEALVLMADLRAKKASSAQLIDGVPAQQFYEEKLAAARSAFAAHDFAAAKAAFDQAQRVKPIPAELKPAYDTATQQMAKIGAANALFAERKYAEAIANLESLQQQDPDNQTIRQMIVDAHFNLGVVALQEERLTDAVREFDEVLKVSPNDELARRSRDLAIRYEGQTKDLLYRIYVKYLPLRQMA